MPGGLQDRARRVGSLGRAEQGDISLQSTHRGDAPLGQASSIELGSTVYSLQSTGLRRELIVRHIMED